MRLSAPGMRVVGCVWQGARKKEGARGAYQAAALERGHSCAALPAESSASCVQRASTRPRRSASCIVSTELWSARESEMSSADSKASTSRALVG
eukprot:3696000-Rhodomonas_salina.1